MSRATSLKVLWGKPVSPPHPTPPASEVGVSGMGPGIGNIGESVLAVTAGAVPSSRGPGLSRGLALACRVDRLRLCGNGVVPLVAAHAWRTLKARFDGDARAA